MNNSELEKELSKRFGYLFAADGYQSDILDMKFLIEFIQQLLDQQREEMVEMIKQKQFGWLSPNKLDSSKGEIVRDFLTRFYLAQEKYLTNLKK